MQYPLQTLALTFLKLGSVSFGGYMSLITMVQDKLVYREKLIHEDLFNELLSLALLMPGPVAVNLISLIGFVVRGPVGALVSFVCIIAPAFFFITILYFLFDAVGSFSALAAFKQGLLTVITSVVFVSGVRMVQKKYRSNLFLLAIAGFILLLFFNSFWHIFFLIITCAIAGWLKYKMTQSKTSTINIQYPNAIWKPLAFLSFFLLLINLSWQNIYLDIMFTFSKVSVTLVGGGYVIIPILQDIVAAKQWLSTAEFWDAIAIGQLCPGPVLISSAIVGFKNAGLLGGLLATLSIFAPAAILIIAVFHIFKNVLKHQAAKAVSDGLAMAIIGLIFYSFITIGATLDMNGLTVMLFLSATALLFFTKINSGVLIISGGLISVIIFLISNQ